ncbi:CaiB/BaiF CoA transferase family protein [Chloroflexota bacterium]
MTQALTDIRVIDWTVLQMGPVAGKLLADLGAEVIKVEQKGVGDLARGVTHIAGQPTGKPGRNFYFEMNGRNKKSVALDLKKKQGKEVIYRLVEKSDVFIHNFRRGVPEGLGLDYDTLRQYNPLLIYACGSGLGSKGPEIGRPYVDGAALARSGFMDTLAPLGMPPDIVPGGISDQMAGGLLTCGILAALVARELQGIGQKVDVSLLGSMIWLQTLTISGYLATGQEEPKHHHDCPPSALYTSYLCADNRWLLLVMMRSGPLWHDICTAIGMPELEHHPHFSTEQLRREHSEELAGLLSKVFASKTSVEWVAIFRQYPDFIYEVVSKVSNLVTDPQVLANEYIVDYSHPSRGSNKVIGIPVKLSQTPGELKLPVPELGQHTEEVLIDVCGYSWQDITQLKEMEVI